MGVMTGGKKLKGCSAGSRKVKKIMYRGQKIWSAGNIVTFQVDTGAAYREEVDEGADCLSQKTFTPTKAGWEFMGWRGDAAAGGNVLSAKAMGDSPITLYAVFRQAVTVTYYNGSASPGSKTEYRFYNNGSVSNPSFTITQSALSGWTARGWSTGTAGNSGITYGNAAAFTRDSDVTLYGMYQQTITLTYNGNGSTGGSTASQSGTRYYNSGNGNTVNPAFKLPSNGFARTGYTFKAWALGSTGGTQYAPGASVTVTKTTAVYAVWIGVAHFFTPLDQVTWTKGGSTTGGHQNNMTVSTDKINVTSRTFENGGYSHCSATAKVSCGGCQKVRIKVECGNGNGSVAIQGVRQSVPGNTTNYYYADVSGESITVELQIVNPGSWALTCGATLTEIYFYN